MCCSVASGNLIALVRCLVVGDCFQHLLAVQVIVITGDNKLTAEAICRKVGVFAVDDDLQGKSITGVEFAKLSIEDRKAFLDTTEGACFSRAEPKHKQVSPALLLP